MSGQDRPSAAELLEAVRELLTGDVLDATEGRVRFHVRVAANALAIVERELADDGAGAAREHAELRALLGTDGSLLELRARLAAAIRDGSLDDRRTEVVRVVRAAVDRRVAITRGDRGSQRP